MKEIKSNNIDPSIKGVIEKLNNINIDFLVVGGLLSQYYLKDHYIYFLKHYFLFLFLMQ